MNHLRSLPIVSRGILAGEFFPYSEVFIWVIGSVPLSVSLKSFIYLLDEGKRFDQRHSELGQVEWLFARWSFDDRAAYYQPR